MHRAYSLDWSPNALSPTTQKTALKKNLKKVAKLQEELQNEITEKNDLLEENTSLKNTVENLHQKLKLKTQENEKLKYELQDLELSNEKTCENLSSRRTAESEILLNNLKLEIAEYKKYIVDLETENENSKKALKKCELKCVEITNEYIILENEFVDLKNNFSLKMEKIEQLQQTCSRMSIELSDLKECNQVLNEEKTYLETNKSSFSENSECLERELHFQFMKEEIERMTTNLQTIEEQQTKLIATNADLTRGKAELLQEQQLLSKENDVLKQHVEKLDGEVHSLTFENASLKNLTNGFEVKLRDTEALLRDREQRIELLMKEYQTATEKLRVEQEELLQKYEELTKHNCQLIAQLETTINEKENFQIALQENKTKLEAKEVEYELLVSKHSEMSLNCDRLVKVLQKTEFDLNALQSSKEKIEKELLFKINMIECLEKNQSSLTASYEKSIFENEKMNRSLTEANNELMTTKKNEADLIAKINEVKAENEKLVLDNNSLIERSENLNEKISLEISMQDELKTQLKTKMFELQTISAERDTLKSDFNEMKKNNTHLIENLRLKNEEIQQNNAELVESNLTQLNTIQNLQSQIEALLCAKDTLSKELQNCEQKYISLMKDFHDKLDAASLEQEVLAAKNVVLHKENTDLQTHFCEVSKEKESYLEKIKTLEENIDELMTSKNYLSDELAKAELNLSENVDKLQEEQKSLMHELESQSLKNQLLEKDNTLLINKISSMAEQENLLRQNLQTHAKQISSLQEELKATLNERDLFSIDASRLTAENTEMHNRFADVSSKCKSLELHLNESEKSIKILTEKNDHQTKTIEDLLTKIANCEKSNSSLSKKLAEDNATFAGQLEKLQQKLNNALEECDVQRQTNIRLTEENTNLVSRTTAITKDNESLLDKLQRFEADHTLLLQKNSEQLEKIRTLENELNSATTDRENLSRKLLESEINFGDKVTTLQEELYAALHDCKLQSEKKSHLTDENANLQTQISDLSIRTQHLQTLLEDQEKEKANLVDLNHTHEDTICQLKSELVVLTTKNHSLAQEIAQCKTLNDEKIDTLNEELGSLVREIESVTKNNHDFAEKNAEFRNKIEELLEEEKLMKIQLEKYKEDNIVSQEKNAQQLNNIQNLELQIKHLSATNDSLSEELRSKERNQSEKWHALENQLNSISQEKTFLANSNSQLAEENDELKTRISSIQKENLDAQQQLKGLHEEKTNSLNDLREMLLSQIDQLQKANEEIREENNKLLEKNAEKLMCLKEVERRFEMLTQDMKELKVKTDELETINSQLQQKVEECKESETNLQNENTALKEFINNSENGKNCLLKQIETLTEREKSLNKNLQNAMKTIEENKQDHRELKKIVAVESQKNDDLKKQNAGLQRKIEQLEIAKEKFVKEAEELANNVSYVRQERNSEFQKLNLENVKLKSRLDELNAQKEELYKMEQINKGVFEDQLQSYTSKNQSLQNEVEKLNDLIQNMDADMINLKEKIKNSESLIAELQSSSEKETTKMKSVLESEKEKYCEISTRLEHFIKENESISKLLETEKQRSHELVQTYETKLQKEMKTKKALEIQLQNVENSEIDSLKKRIDELKTKLEEVVESNECLTETSKLKTNQHEFLLKENENLMHKIDQLEKHLSTAETEYDRLLEEKQENRKQNDDVRIQLKNLNELLGTKNNDIIRLKDEYAVFKEEYRKLALHKGELDKEFKETILQENAKLSKKCNELSDANLKFVEQLSEKMKLIESLNAEIDRSKQHRSDADGKLDLNETRTVSSGCENEIYMNLRKENIKLVEERENFKKQLSDMSRQLEKEKETYRSKAQSLYNKISTKMIAEYEGKLERAKVEYQKIMKQKYSMQESDWKKREEEYKLMLKKEKEHIRDLSSQMWDISDKYLQLKQKFETKPSPLKFRTQSEETLFSPSTLSRRTKSATQLNFMGCRNYRVSDFDRRLSTMSEDIQPQVRRRQTISGKKFSLSSAKVFPCEDEEQEIFDNACLADLKLGRISIDDSHDFSKQRLSILQQRNSQCPPHLKSSYPAETQFIPPQEFKENDIKMGLTGENDNSDIENLIPRDSRESLRKNRNQTSYKKPGPPTPSKNGGRTNQLEHHETPRNILKESNDIGNNRRKSFTPKFLNNLFALKGHATVTIPQDENISTTPRQTRLSSIRRRFSRNPQELGNTNSGFC